MLIADIEVTGQEAKVLDLLARSAVRLTEDEIRTDLNDQSVDVVAMVYKRLVIGTTGKFSLQNVFPSVGTFITDKGQAVCRLPFCSEPHHARGFCQSHYKLIRKTVRKRANASKDVSYYGLTRTGLLKANLMGLTTLTALPYWTKSPIPKPEDLCVV